VRSVSRECREADEQAPVAAQKQSSDEEKARAVAGARADVKKNEVPSEEATQVPVKEVTKARVEEEEHGQAKQEANEQVQEEAGAPSAAEVSKPEQEKPSRAVRHKTLMKNKAKQLQAMCKKAGLDTKGKKSILCDRLIDAGAD
jgi:3-methyladenine DNA glycosylase/8-oxoguanine DNA glycosylase